MSNQKISQLTALTGADATGADLIPVVDVAPSATTKRMTRAEFFKNVPDMEITDKIIHSGDTNTAIRFPANDTVTVETNGSERFRIDSTGNVGFGTNSPQAVLDVVDIAPVFGDARGTNSDKGWRPRIPTFTGETAEWFSPFFVACTSGSNRLSLGGGTNTAFAATELRFFTASDAATASGSERMRITSAGNVGIGTTTPGSALDVNGQISGKFTNVGTNTAAQGLATNHVSQVTISADTTLTTTVPPAGTMATVIIVTSGATSRTVTFGTGFASTGTLATGTTTSRRFVVSFVSDGTRLLETGRTTAITV